MDYIVMYLIGSWVAIILLFLVLGVMMRELADLRESVIAVEEAFDRFVAEQAAKDTTRQYANAVLQQQRKGG